MSILKTAFQMLVGGDRQDLASGQIWSKEEMVKAGARIYDPADPVPIAPPIGYKREPSMMEVVKGMVLQEKVKRLQQELGADTPEEAEDFDVGEEDDSPSSLYEFERHEHELLQAYEKLQRHHHMMHEKYGKKLPDFMTEPQAGSGGAGGRPPAEVASATVPEPGKPGSKRAKPASEVPLPSPAKSEPDDFVL